MLPGRANRCPGAWQCDRVRRVLTTVLGLGGVSTFLIATSLQVIFERLQGSLLICARACARVRFANG